MNFVSIVSAAETAEKAESAGISALGLDIFAILAQTLTFLVLFFIVKKFALEKIVKNLDERNKTINRGLHLTAELDKQQAELEQKVEAVLKSARKDADGIIAEAKTESGKIIQAAEESANRRAEEIIRTAEGKIERDIAEARAGLKDEMAGLIASATEAILQEKLDASSDRKLVEKYLNEVMK
jgi:F-type H+-transporting ATPase subunit b